MGGFGRQLREARSAKGLEIGDVARRLKLRPAMVEALEAEAWERLPEPALTRGYLRNYALALGLDPKPLLALCPGGVALAAKPQEPAEESTIRVRVLEPAL
ncbi:helix-turn-helix domain-containing protein [Calidithermus roseus]|uniref:Helix-turn-helix domain protein n=1 Tax=Calidithermus roseus TaxID=1644118 RepID=A0A399F124_9DEIN|nr:helix-turn-helix transcriptional regulator [Calidithermus roseus]RIH88989.1 Helix-turn-helix domain protein [Calidithermus roseus]